MMPKILSLAQLHCQGHLLLFTKPLQILCHHHTAGWNVTVRPLEGVKEGEVGVELVLPGDVGLRV
jgi:hypothetical protein